MNMTNAIMDFILMALLVAALWFGVRLDRRLRNLRAAHEGFARAVHDLDDAAIRAHASLKDLRSNAEESQELLHGRIVAARDLLQKLNTQVAHAERVQGGLDRSLETMEALQAMPVVPRPRPEPRPSATPCARASKTS